MDTVRLTRDSVSAVVAGIVSLLRLCWVEKPSREAGLAYEVRRYQAGAATARDLASYWYGSTYRTANGGLFSGEVGNGFLLVYVLPESRQASLVAGPLLYLRSWRAPGASDSVTSGETGFRPGLRDAQAETLLARDRHLPPRLDASPPELPSAVNGCRPKAAVLKQRARLEIARGWHPAGTRPWMG